MATIDPELRALFVDEATEGLQSLEASIQELQDGSTEAIHAAFRVVHNLKGAARMAGFTRMERVAHTLEDALATCRKLGGPPEPEVQEQLRTAIGLMAQLLAHPDLDPGTEAFAAAVRTSLQIESAAPTPSVPSAELPPATVRIEAARLNTLMHFAGEFMVTTGRLSTHHSALEGLHTSLEQLQRGATGELRAALGGLTRDLGLLVQSHRSEVQRFGYTVADWSGAIKRARMLPLAGAVARWRLTVTDAAHALGREVRLVADVGDIEIDRQILDGLRDPVMHLLRNAVDHGIESPADREAAGKPRTGTITLRATTVGPMVALEVTDDGAGLDPVRIGRAAIARGVVEADALSRLSQKDVLDLVFTAGLSTAERVTNLSGRGVGLNVVRQRLEQLGGNARIVASSKGTVVRLEAPATVVSTRGLLVRTENVAYVVPMSYIARTLRVPSRSVQTIDGGSAVSIEGEEPIRVRWLASLMSQRRTPDPEALLIVVLTDSVARLGLVVHEIIGEVEFVTKRLPWNVPAVRGVAGAMIVGDGSVALVLDGPRVLHEARSAVEGRADGVHIAEPVRKRRVLVVDDSLTSRTLERNILVAAGYEVDVAVDGEAAWTALGNASYDLVVVDVEMPRLNGLDLTRRIRAAEKTKTTPVILVTSLDNPGDIAAGAAAGADEYIVKGRFDQRKLLEAVARLV